MENLNHNDHNHIKNSGRTWSGFIIVIIGIAFLLNNLGLDIPDWVFSFGTILIVIGIFLGVRKNFKGIGWLILILVGAYNIIDKMDLDFDLSKYALGFGLVIIGGFLILRPKNRLNSKAKFKERLSDDFTQTAAEGEPFNNSNISNDTLDVMAVFGGNNQTVYSKNFIGGNITAVFGGADIIMVQADFAETATIDVTAVFGGIKLIVPQNWAIKSNVTALFGSVEDKRSHFAPVGEMQKVLIIEGTAMFGGIEIKSF